MDARIRAWSLLICLGLGAPLAASTADDCLSQGRLRLFDGTESGPARACDILAAGLADANGAQSPQRRELLFLHALARATVLLGDPNDSVVPDGLLRWVEPFSDALAVNVLADPSDHLPVRPDANPNPMGEWSSPSAAREIDEIAAELGSIADRPTPFVMILVSNETGLKNDLEIDYGDVLMLRSVLLARRASLQKQPFPELGIVGGAWARDRRVLERLDAWADEPLSLLGFACLPGEDRGWRTYWADAVACYLDAVAYIVAEDDPPGTDPQQDELVYIDPSAQAHIDHCKVARGTTARPPETIFGTRVYDVCDANSVRLGKLVLVFDATETGGHEGRLTLDDGTDLEIDWFGVLDAGEIGISMFAPDEATQGWLQGAIAVDRSVITDATVDFWGDDTRVIVALTARLTGETTQEPSDPAPLVGASLPAPALEIPMPLDELLTRAGNNPNWGM